MKAMKWMLAAAMIVSPVTFGQVLVTSGSGTQGGGVELQAGGLRSVAQVKDDLFAGTEKFAEGASDVTEINLDPSMMGMVKKGKDGEIAKKMRYMVIHTYEYPKPGMYRMEDVEVYRKKLADGSWSCSIRVKDKSGTTDICSRQTADHEGSEMVILTAEPKELTFIHMSGNVSLEDLGKMGATMGGQDGDGAGLKKR